MTILLQHKYRLTVGTPGESVEPITDLSFRFKIKKKQDGTSQLSATLYNPGEDQLVRFEPENQAVILDLGYESIGVSEAFQGTITSFKTEFEGNTLLVRFKAKDGYQAQQRSFASYSFGSGVTRREVITQLVNGLEVVPTGNGETLPVTLGILTGDRMQDSFENGYAVSGSAMIEIEKLLRPIGYAYNIDAGKFYAYPLDGPRGTQVIVLSPSSGLLGSPRKARIPAKNNQPELLGYMANALMFPTISQGSLVKLESEEVNGFFKAETVQFIGDFTGNKWNTEMFLIEAPGNTDVGELRTTPIETGVQA